MCKFSQIDFVNGRNHITNYEALEYDGRDLNFHYIWVRDLKTGIRKQIVVSHSQVRYLKTFKIDGETGEKSRDWERVDVPTPEWLQKLLGKSV